MFYSKSTGGFYTTEIHDIMPEDVVEITDTEYQSALDGQSQGLQIVADTNGKPITQVRVHTASELWAEYQAKAQALLVKSDTVAIRCAKKGIAYPADWQAYDDELRAIVSALTGTPTTLPTQPAYPA